MSNLTCIHISALKPYRAKGDEMQKGSLASRARERELSPDHSTSGQARPPRCEPRRVERQPDTRRN